VDFHQLQESLSGVVAVPPEMQVEVADILEGWGLAA